MNEPFQAVFSNVPEQCIDKYLTQLTVRSCFLSYHYQVLQQWHVDILDQKTAAYRLDLKTKYRFYLSMFFDLMDVTHVNSHFVHMKLGDDI